MLRVSSVMAFKKRNGVRFYVNAFKMQIRKKILGEMQMNCTTSLTFD